MSTEQSHSTSGGKGFLPNPVEFLGAVFDASFEQADHVAKKSAEFMQDTAKATADPIVHSTTMGHKSTATSGASGGSSKGGGAVHH